MITKSLKVIVTTDNKNINQLIAALFLNRTNYYLLPESLKRDRSPKVLKPVCISNRTATILFPAAYRPISVKVE